MHVMYRARVWTRQTTTLRNFEAAQKRGMYNLEPEHQRRNVHGHEWQQNIITSFLEFHTFFVAPTFHQRMMPNGTVQWEILDGRQTCNAILCFMNDELAVEFVEYDGKVLFSELSPHHQQFIVDNLTIDLNFLHETLDDDEIYSFRSMRLP
jgi:hypothetical protein